MSLWTTYFLALLALVNLVTATNVVPVFQENDIIPQVIDADEMQPLEVTFGDTPVNLGNELTPNQTMDQPTVNWECDPYDYYTLIFTDPDVPSRENQTLAEFIHWVVVNILCNDISNGDTIVDYVGSAPPLDSGLHRYIFFLFKQSGKQTFDEPRLGVNGTGMARTGFSTREFADKYELGPPEEGNFYVAQYDDTVNTTLAELGF